MNHQQNMEYLAKVLIDRGYLVVSCPLPQEYKVGDVVPQNKVFVTSAPMGSPIHIISMNAQWPDDPNLFSPQEAKLYRFYRVSLD